MVDRDHSNHYWNGYNDAMCARVYDPNTIDQTLRIDYMDGWAAGRCRKIAINETENRRAP